MDEQIISFGEQGHLHGILSNPEKINPELPAILFWNAGLVHKYGVHRIQVNLSRKLAELGFSCLRFDMAGLGDSANVSFNKSYEENAVISIQQAIDYVNKKNSSTQVVLVGFCSGALNAHEALTQDSRISGAVLIDSYVYRTRKFYFILFFRLLTSIKIISLFFRAVKKKIKSYTAENMEALSVNWEFPEKSKVARDLQSFVERKVKLLVIYTNDMPKYYNYKKQFLDMFPEVDFKDSLTLSFYKKTDHLFTPLNEKSKLMSEIINWISGNYKK